MRLGTLAFNLFGPYSSSSSIVVVVGTKSPITLLTLPIITTTKSVVTVSSINSLITIKKPN